MKPRADYDVVVVGSGVAGLTCALRLAGRRRVLLVTAGELRSGSTPWAQGGIAAAIGADDDPRAHAEDTNIAGAGMCDDGMLDVLTGAAPNAVARLIGDGVQFDLSADRTFALTREGGHHCDRVLHAGGDATGAEVSRALAAAVRASGVDVLEYTSVIDLAVTPTATGPQVAGVVLSSSEVVTARSVVLATGGVGSVFRASTNPAEVAGDGLALALRAGASLVDLEFVQFHPTGLRVDGIGQVPLISEALRGEGAVLRDGSGAPIMAGQHPLADLAPRDIVARRIDAILNEPGGWVGLDASGFEPGVLEQRFPTAYRICRDHGIDPTSEPIPVAPVQHFLCGGIRTDSFGATDVGGLYAVGECAATGVHGANRLASNSLLEGLVFGARTAAALRAALPEPVAPDRCGAPMPVVPESAISVVRSTMSKYAGVRRSAAGLAAADVVLQGLLQSPCDETSSVDAANRWTVASAIVAAASARRESRGCHWRSDHPESSESWRHRVVVRLDAGMPMAEPELVLGRSA